MPRVNNKYVCPAWKDNAAPAIDAAELLAIGQSIVANQTDIETLKTAIAAVSGAAKIQTGSYVGTGTYGESNPCSLTFDFVPRCIIIFRNVANHSNFTGTFVNPSTSYEGTTWADSKCSWSNKSMSWRNDGSARNQLNESGHAYNFVAIG